MKGINAIALALTATTASASLVPHYFKRASSLASVSVQGNAFFAGGNRFYIRGVDYQPGGSSGAVDPIADQSTCTRDITEFQKLKINTVRIYTVDNSQNHDACMSALATAGIYLALDVNTPKYSINQDDPAPSYNADYLQSVFSTIDAFHTYSNTLLFFSGNEDINSVATTSSAPYVKAVTRDMKNYISARKYRSIPVGYSAADVDTLIYQTADFMNCGDDAMARSDFFAYNDYSWCDPSSFEGSTWQAKATYFANFSIPLFLSEYGCVKTTRQFQEIATLYGPQMTPSYSGGLAYEYSKEGTAPPADLYGLVEINGNSITELTDFGTLASAFSNTSSPTGSGGYRPSGSPAICPTQDSNWNVTTGSELPVFPSAAATYLKNGAGTAPGLSGSGSQNSGPASVAFASGSSVAATGTSTSTSTSTSGSKKSAADGRVIDSAPVMACGLVVAMSTLLGMALL